MLMLTGIIIHGATSDDLAPPEESNPRFIIHIITMKFGKYCNMIDYDYDFLYL